MNIEAVGKTRSNHGYKNQRELAMVVNSYYPSTWKMET